MNNQKEWFDEGWGLMPGEMKYGGKVAFMHFKTSVKTEEDFDKFKLALRKYVFSVEMRRKNGFPGLSYKAATNFCRDWQDFLEYEYKEPELQPKTQADINRGGQGRVVL